MTTGNQQKRLMRLQAVNVDPYTKAKYPYDPEFYLIDFPLSPEQLDITYNIKYSKQDNAGGFSFPQYQGRQPRVVKFTARFADQYTRAYSRSLPLCSTALDMLQRFAEPRTGLSEVDQQRLTELQDELEYTSKRDIDLVYYLETEIQAIQERNEPAPPPLLSFFGGQFSMYCKLTGLSISVLRLNTQTGTPFEADASIQLSEYLPIPTERSEESEG